MPHSIGQMELLFCSMHRGFPARIAFNLHLPPLQRLAQVVSTDEDRGRANEEQRRRGVSRDTLRMACRRQSYECPPSCLEAAPRVARLKTARR